MNKLEGMPGDLFRMITAALGSRGGTHGAADGKQADAQAFHDLLHAFAHQKKPGSTGQSDAGPAEKGKSHLHASASSAHKDEADGNQDGEALVSTDKQDAANEVLQQLLQRSQPPGDQQKMTSLLPQAGQEIGLPTQIAQLAGSVLQAKQGPMSVAKRDVGSLTEAGAQDANGVSWPGAVKDGSTEHLDGASAVDPGKFNMLHGGVAMPSDISEELPFEPSVTAKLGSVAGLETQAASAPEIPKITVVQQETHLPPVLPLTQVQKIADAIVSEIKNSSATTATPASDVASSTKVGPDQPLKILTIQLEPASLGSVTIRFRLTGDAVTIHLAADRSDTTQLLQQQRDALCEVMRTAGYVADVASVRHGVMDGLQSGAGQQQQQSALGQHSQQQQQSSHGQGSSDASGSWSNDGQDGARQNRQEHRQQQESNHEQGMVPRNSRRVRFL